jgi:hypothetical protein
MVFATYRRWYYWNSEIQNPEMGWTLREDLEGKERNFVGDVL